MAPQETPATIYEMNKVDNEKVVVKNDSSVAPNDGCCKKCTDRIILALEDFFGG